MHMRRSRGSGPKPGVATAFYELIKEKAAQRGWTQALLAAEAGVDRSTIVRMKTGRPQAETVMLLANALDIPTDEALRMAGLIGPPREDLDLQRPLELLEDPETEALLARLPEKRRKQLERFREIERRRVRDLQRSVDLQAEQFRQGFLDLLREEVEPN